MIAIVVCLAAAVQLPAAIADYYRDYNFVNTRSGDATFRRLTPALRGVR